MFQKIFISLSNDFETFSYFHKLKIKLRKYCLKNDIILKLHYDHTTVFNVVSSPFVESTVNLEKSWSLKISFIKKFYVKKYVLEL